MSPDSLHILLKVSEYGTHMDTGLIRYTFPPEYDMNDDGTY